MSCVSRVFRDRVSLGPPVQSPGTEWRSAGRARPAPRPGRARPGVTVRRDRMPGSSPAPQRANPFWIDLITTPGLEFYYRNGPQATNRRHHVRDGASGGYRTFHWAKAGLHIHPPSF
eukprot:342506-Hanusia_phi.AAC.1